MTSATSGGRPGSELFATYRAPGRRAVRWLVEPKDPATRLRIDYRTRHSNRRFLRDPSDAARMGGVIGQWQSLIIDCPNPRALALFYEQLLGMERLEDSADWVTIGGAGQPTVAFQAAPDFVPPRWKDPAASQRMHMDVLVGDLDTAQALVLKLGASLLEGSDKPVGYRVYADPIGQPFCLITPESLA